MTKPVQHTNNAAPVHTSAEVLHAKHGLVPHKNLGAGKNQKQRFIVKLIP